MSTRSQTSSTQYTSQKGKKQKTTTSPEQFAVSIKAIRAVCIKLKEQNLLVAHDKKSARRALLTADVFKDLDADTKKSVALHVVLLKAATRSTLSRGQLLARYVQILQEGTNPNKRKAGNDASLDEEESTDAPTPATAPTAGDGPTA